MAYLRDLLFYLNLGLILTLIKHRISYCSDGLFASTNFGQFCLIFSYSLFHLGSQGYQIIPVIETLLHGLTILVFKSE